MADAALYQQPAIHPQVLITAQMAGSMRSSKKIVEFFSLLSNALIALVNNLIISCLKFGLNPLHF